MTENNAEPVGVRLPRARPTGGRTDRGPRENVSHSWRWHFQGEWTVSFFAPGLGGQKSKSNSPPGKPHSLTWARACTPLSLTFCPGQATPEGGGGRTREDPSAATAKTVCSLCRSPPPSKSKKHLLSENALSSVGPSGPSVLHSFVPFLSHSSFSFVPLQRATIMHEGLMAKTHRRRRRGAGAARGEGARERSRVS